MLMLGSLEAGYVILRHTFGVVRVLRLTTSIDGCRVIEAAGIEPLRSERPCRKDLLATLTRLPLCARVCCKSLCD